ncbi:T9SS type A sorting domain-containing protein [Hyphobacterium sp. CCMP332]|nr:T9SS type A sorting domain-containing protein [Hyphobacterium sp. CCMP332]
MKLRLKNILEAVIITVFFNNQLFSQTDPGLKVYQFEERNLEGNCVKLYNNAELIIGGRIDDNVLIMRTDLDGNILWKHEYDITNFEDRVTDLVIEGSTLFVIGQNQTLPGFNNDRIGFVLCIDLANNNNLNWVYETDRNDPDIRFRGAAFDAVQNVLRVVGSHIGVFNSNALMIELDPLNGTQVYERIFDNAQYQNGSDDFISILYKQGLNSSFTFGRSMIAGGSGASRATSLVHNHTQNIFTDGTTYFENWLDGHRMYGSDLDYGVDSATSGDVLSAVAIGDDNNDNVYESYVAVIADGSIQGHIPGAIMGTSYMYDISHSQGSDLRFQEIIHDTPFPNNISYYILATVRNLNGDVDLALIALDDQLSNSNLWAYRYNVGLDENFSMNYNSQLAYDASSNIVYFTGKTNAYDDDNLRTDLLLYKIDGANGKAGYLCGEKIDLLETIHTIFNPINFNDNEPTIGLDVSFFDQNVQDPQILDKCQCYSYGDFSPFKRAYTVETQEEGIDEEVEKPIDLASMNVYPNPSNNNITISLSNKEAKISELRLMDFFGTSFITDQNLAGDHMIDISRLRNGVYFLNVIDDNGNRYLKQIIKN